MVRLFLLLVWSLAALSAAAQAHDSQAYGHAYWSYIRCNEEAVRDLVRRQITQRADGMILGEWPRKTLALDAMAMCKAQEEALGPLVPGGLSSEFAARMQEFNVGIIEAEKIFQKQGLVCAGAEWAGCSMKAIPNWKGVRP